MDGSHIQKSLLRNSFRCQRGPRGYSETRFAAIGLKAAPFDAKKASGLRFYKEGCKVKGNEAEWPKLTAEQLEWALSMRRVITERSVLADDRCGMEARGTG